MSKPEPIARRAALCVTADATLLKRTLLRRIKEVPALKRVTPAFDETADAADALALFPITDKSTLAEWDTRAYAMPDRMIALFSETSGTTGARPLLTPRGRDELRWNTFNQARAYHRHLRPGLDRIAILHPVLMSPFAEASAFALHDLGIGYLRLFPIPRICDYARIARILDDYRVTAIMTTPTLAYKVVFELMRMRRMPRHLDKLLLTGENLTSATFANFDRLLGRGRGAARAFVYGSSEAATVMYGVADGTYRGFLEDFAFEILPSGASWEAALSADAPRGAITGRLLITWLQDGIMPLVRYDTGDTFTAWFDGAAREWVFRAHARAHAAGASPLVAAGLDEICFGAATPAVHYDLTVEDERAVLNVITIQASDDGRLLAQTLEQGVRNLIGLPTSVRLNPGEHPFFEFSPLAKTTRIEVRKAAHA